MWRLFTGGVAPIQHAFINWGNESTTEPMRIRTLCGRYLHNSTEVQEPESMPKCQTCVNALKRIGRTE